MKNTVYIVIIVVLSLGAASFAPRVSVESNSVSAEKAPRRGVEHLQKSLERVEVRCSRLERLLAGQEIGE